MATDYVYVDTNIFVYLLEGTMPVLADAAADAMERHAGKGGRLVTSTLTITEFFGGDANVPQDSLHQVLGLDFVALNEDVAMNAAKLQRKEKLSLGDAIHLATAMSVENVSFFTNDKRLAKIAGRYVKAVTLDS